MTPFNKAQWVLGYSSLMLMTEQDRQHWLLKTDRIVQSTDSNTGGMYLGQIDNSGSSINVSTQKMSTLHPVLKLYLPTNLQTIFELSPSALPFSYDVNGLCCARIVSTQYQYEGTNKSYKIRFEDCADTYIPFSNMNNSNVYGYHFIKTTTRPKLLMLDSNNQYTIEIDIQLLIDNGVYYYPLDTFQPIDIEDKGSGIYETVLISDDSMIGYPAFWFTCDQTIVGPSFSINPTPQKFNFCGNKKNNLYDVNVYIMDQLYVDNNKVRVYSAQGYTFSGTASDFSIPIDLNSVAFTLSTQPVTTEPIVIPNQQGTLYMSNQAEWTYNVNEGGCYECLIRNFNHNYSTHQLPLTPIFTLQLDFNIPFEKSTNDYGFAGIDITSDTEKSDYPFNLSSWSGLPDWITDDHNTTQRTIIYAIHETPNSSEENPESRQTAALILDPGVPYSDEDDPTRDEDYRKGRVYVLSNDEPEYVNNANTPTPKPGRTVARICDIPTSVTQLTNVSGIAPTSVIDPQYIRSEASFTFKENERLMNTLSNKWVRPIHYTVAGVKAITLPNEDNPHVFMNLSNLKSINLLNPENDFREHINLNGSPESYVKPDDVSLYMIMNGGNGYQENDVGNIVIGGFAFNYTVNEVDENGTVKALTVSFSNSNIDEWKINIADFNMNGNTGVTDTYDTYPVGSSQGSGLRVILQIENYQDKVPAYGNIYPDLFALVQCVDGLFMYTYDTESNEWNRSVCISKFESQSQSEEVSVKDSYINSILPNIHILPTGLYDTDEPEDSLMVVSTASFVNIVDRYKTPFKPTERVPSTKIPVDLTRFYCSMIYKKTATIKSFDGIGGILDTIQENNYDRFDSYIIWRWDDPNDANNKDFSFGIVHRSFNNLQSFDNTTFLPDNDLNCKNYVNTNASTTIVWDTQEYNTTLVWTFNPFTNIREIYTIDPDTYEVHVSRYNMNWDSVKVYSDNFQTEYPMVDSNNKLLWNIATNVITESWNSTIQDPIYQQPPYYSLLSIRDDITTLSDNRKPQGNWQLVFPRIQTLTFKSSTGYEYEAKNIHKLNVIKDIGTLDRTDVYDINGKPVNAKTLIISSDKDENTSSIKVYNLATGRWNDI